MLCHVLSGKDRATIDNGIQGRHVILDHGKVHDLVTSIQNDEDVMLSSLDSAVHDVEYDRNVGIFGCEIAVFGVR